MIAGIFLMAFCLAYAFFLLWCITGWSRLNFRRETDRKKSKASMSSLPCAMKRLLLKILLPI